MGDDIERAPSVFPFILGGPRFRQITQKRIESSGGASEKRYCLVQVMFGHIPCLVGGKFSKN
jgi:hypothetical protein